jgi:hypothetical protein
MFPLAARFTRAAITSVVLVACADSTPPTQPASVASASQPTRPTMPAVLSDVGVAATPTTLYACYTPGKGSMYRIKTADTPAECEKKDIQFSWTDSPSRAIAGVVFASASATLPADGRYFPACPDGKSVLNFGPEITVNSTGTTAQILSNRPTLSGGKIGWVFRAAAGTTWVFYWTCADVETVTSVL